MSGLLLLNKPKDKSSYGAVACIKRLTGEKRVGHTGTLDPMATGVLPILIGRATALSSYLLESDKGYIARVRLGTVTDTCDITGNITAQNEVAVTNTELCNTLKQFTGALTQRPPMFSALKKDGVRLYDLARKGETVEIPERKIEVYSLEIISPLDENFEFEIKVFVSKGTYIRSLARDIGEALGCGATLTALQRIKTSGFDISQCVDLEDLTQDNINECIISEETVVMQFRSVEITDKQAVRFCNGGQLALDRLKITDIHNGEILRVRHGGVFLGLGEANTERELLNIKCIINDIRTEGIK